MPVSKVKTLGEIIGAIQDSCATDAEAIAKLEELIRDRKIQFDNAPQVSRAAEPSLRLVHSRPRSAGPLKSKPRGLYAVAS